jgi:hypothetical protein
MNTASKTIRATDKERAVRREQWRKFNEGAEQVLQRLSTDVGTTSDSVTLLRTIRNYPDNQT